MTFQELCNIEPRLRSLYEEATAVKDDGTQDWFCANLVFSERFKPRLKKLVGVHAENPHSVLGTDWAYQLAAEAILDALPECWNCGCMEAPRFSRRERETPFACAVCSKQANDSFIFRWEEDHRAKVLRGFGVRCFAPECNPRIAKAGVVERSHHIWHFATPDGYFSFLRAVLERIADGFTLPPEEARVLLLFLVKCMDKLTARIAGGTG